MMSRLLNFLTLLRIVQFSSAIFKISNGASENTNSFKTFNDYRANMQLHTVKIFSREEITTLKGYSCSGSIIDYEWIITSAHCVYGFEIIDVFIGNVTNDLDHIVRASSVFIHPDFENEDEIINDIALLKLRRSLRTLNNSFEIVALPNGESDGEKEYVGLKGIIAGYGKLGDCEYDAAVVMVPFQMFSHLAGPTANVPNFAYYEILPLKECQNLFLRNYTEYTSTALCGKGIGASSCQGDSGQGLIIYRQGVKKIIGIVSKGFESCEIIEPEVFTRVDKFVDFIEEVIKNY